MDFKSRKVISNKEGHYITIKRLILQEDIIILKVNAQQSVKLHQQVGNSGDLVFQSESEGQQAAIKKRARADIVDEVQRQSAGESSLA